ncbi:AraC family transcriptional regulator [Catenovulum maritimum]|uniref:AraC family transcriptional regulator n=1 Tax=Catenovulum maritimum TaxID=1513271 RepID=A0A0J8JMD9_9ALTE|nr:GyrI-like domain-containing protein [Catenovulum maritimum]KMT65771.1 AraC family transcriptional regulator [Catenovulum maritimum]
MLDNQKISRINDVLFHIHQDITQPLPAKQLAAVAAYSEQHFHRIFKLVVGDSVHAYIRRARMEYAANQLMFDSKASVLEVATKCGFSSVSSFSRAFKATFGTSPGQWRDTESQTKEKPYLKDPEIAAAYQRVDKSIMPKAELIELPARQVAYVRHKGYGRSISIAWQILKAWAESENRDFTQQFGLHHSNPAVTELDKCRYVACLAIDKPLTRRGVVNSLTIPGGLYAVFKLKGKYGDLLPQLSLILEQWLPTSGFKMLSTPAYVHYHQNQFLDNDEKFSLDFCLPVSLFF